MVCNFSWTVITLEGFLERKLTADFHFGICQDKDYKLQPREELIVGRNRINEQNTLVNNTLIQLAELKNLLSDRTQTESP